MGAGERFIRYCDEQLRAQGVQAVYHHVKAKQSFGPTLTRQGYELVDLIYAKRLDRPSGLTETGVYAPPSAEEAKR